MRQRHVQRIRGASAIGFCLTAGMLFCASAAAQAVIPPLTDRVVDQAGVLSESTERTLIDFLKVLEDSTSNQVVVVTVPSLEDEPIESFALRAGREWGIGTDEHDNGVLLVVAPNDRQVRIEVGYGLEGALPDAVAARIIRNEIIPRFRDGDIDEGVADGVYAIARALEGEYRQSSDEDLESDLGARAFISSIFLGLALLGAFTALMMNGAGRWLVSAFLLPFFGVPGFLMTMSWAGGLLSMATYFGLFILLSRNSGVERLRKKVARAAEKGESYAVSRGWTLSTGSGSWSSSSSSGSSGFSGGGGSFGGGGASGSW